MITCSPSNRFLTQLPYENSSHVLPCPERILALNLQWHPHHLQNKGSTACSQSTPVPCSPKSTSTATVSFPSLSMALFFCFFLTETLNIHYTATNLCWSKIQSFGTQKNEEASFSMFIKHLLRASFCGSWLSIPP